MTEPEQLYRDDQRYCAQLRLGEAHPPHSYRYSYRLALTDVPCEGAIVCDGLAEATPPWPLRNPAPVLTADVVLLAPGRQADFHVAGTSGLLSGPGQVLLIRRGHDPHAGSWALPGGRVEGGETFMQAAKRELLEETGLFVASTLGLVGLYDTPGRDPRGHYVSAAFLAHLSTTATPKPGDDATQAQWWSVADVLAHVVRLAFDHQKIISDAVATTLRFH